ncbi:AAA-ATPase_like domain-containing protein [Gammaproteobacteria bacterium]
MNTQLYPQASKFPLRIPYGVADFVKLRQRGHYFVDKTHYLPLLEQAGEFLFLIRPRRFGKSLLQSVMECYYDRRWEPQFDELFHDTWIHDHPTPEKHGYLVLRFDFSAVDSASRKMEESFETYTRIELESFVQRYQRWIPEELGQKILREKVTIARIEQLLRTMDQLGLPLYLFIDEYDNFANNLLVREGRQKYQELTHGGGFFRHFFSVLKEGIGRSGSGLSRLFITGVSPITMDDVTSGFNIGANISLDPEFNSLLGFNAKEMESLFAAFGQNYSEHRAVLNDWYDHYHFHRQRGEPVTNSDMALYYLKSLYRLHTPPDELIDHNVRIDYGKLRYLVQIDKTLNGNFSRLREIIETGEQVGDIQLSFPVEALLQQENFVSLLYYLGLLTFAGERDARPLLRIPNRTIRQLMYGYLREAYREVEIFKPSLWKIGDLLNAMAYRGEWAAFFDYLSEQIQEQASVRDYLQGEKMVQGFLLAYLNLSPYFVCHSEQESGRGFVDLFLAPFFFRYPDMRHGYLIELKYLARSEDSPEQRQKMIIKAEAQLRSYSGDERVQKALGAAWLHPLVLVYSGWELVYRAEVDIKLPINTVLK